MVGVSATGSISLGTAFVAGKTRVPMPAAVMIAFVMGIVGIVMIPSVPDLACTSVARKRVDTKPTPCTLYVPRLALSSARLTERGGRGRSAVFAVKGQRQLIG